MQSFIAMTHFAKKILLSTATLLIIAGTAFAASSDPYGKKSDNPQQVMCEAVAYNGHFVLHMLYRFSIERFKSDYQTSIKSISDPMSAVVHVLAYNRGIKRFRKIEKALNDIASAEPLGPSSKKTIGEWCDMNWDVDTYISKF